MQGLKRIFFAGVFFLLVLPFFSCAEEPKAADKSSAASSRSGAQVPGQPKINIDEIALEALQTAFRTENNNKARYLAFAESAEKDGWSRSALLFRALARAEQVQTGHYSALIEKLGDIAPDKAEPTAVKSIRENLKAALDSETYEISKLYPELLTKLHNEKFEETMKFLAVATQAKNSHMSFLKGAFDLAGSGKKGKILSYYVCPVCGNLFASDTRFTTCPVCGAPKKDFIEVK